MPEEEVVFETSRIQKPMSQAELIFQELSKALKAEPGSSERALELSDVQALLAPQRLSDIEGTYEQECQTAKMQEIEDMNNGAMNAHIDFQNRWLEAMMRLMKRSGLLGKEYVQG